MTRTRISRMKGERNRGTRSVVWKSRHNEWRCLCAVCFALADWRIQTEFNEIVCAIQFFTENYSLSLFDKNNKFISDRLKSLLRKKEEQRRRHFYDERRHIVEVDKCDCWSDYSIYYHLFSHKGTHKRTPHDYDSQRLSIYLCWNHRSLWMWFLPRFGCVFCVCDLRISILSVNYYFIIIFLLCVAFDMLFILLLYSTAETEDRREAGNTVQYYYYCCYSRFTGPKLKSWMLNDEKNTFFLSVST